MSVRGDMADQFCEQFGETALEELCEAALAQEDIKDVVCFLDHHMVNAANWIHDGYFCHDGEEYMFRLEMGDQNGCVLQYGLDFEPKPFVALRYKFKPAISNKTSEKIFALWRKQKWFIDMEGKMNYDFLFSPTSAIKNHYRDWAAKKGMVIEVE